MTRGASVVPLPKHLSNVPSEPASRDLEHGAGGTSPQPLSLEVVGMEDVLFFRSSLVF